MLQKWIFSHVSEIINTGKKRKINLSDFPELPKNWNPSVVKIPSVSSLTRAEELIMIIIKELKPQLSRLLLLIILLMIFRFSAPVFLKLFLKEISSLNAGHTITQLALAFGLCSTQLSQALTSQQYIYFGVTSSQTGINYLNQYFHHFILYKSQYHQRSDEWVNRLHYDVEMVGTIVWHYLELTQLILSILISCSLLFYFLGVSFLPSILVLMLVFPFGKWFSSKFAYFQSKQMNYKDSRISKMAQFLDGIKVIKSFVWEKVVEKRIKYLRQQEEKMGLQIATYKAFSIGVFSLTNTFAAFCALWFYALSGAKLDASLIFTVFTLFSILEPCLRQLPKQLGEISSARIAADRLIKESSLLELQNFSRTEQLQSDELIKIESASFSINNKLILNDVNLSFRRGESIAILGRVGSGKTSLIKVLLKLVDIQIGAVRYKNDFKFSYVPQDSFLFTDNLKNNITLGSIVEDSLLDMAIDLSGLRKDLDQLPGGLDFEVLENGINLSGGQKQRVSIARAIIFNPDIVVMDDPFSAVDPLTERLIGNELFFKFWKDKTRIVTTHRYDFLPNFDRVIIIEDGIIIGDGTYQDLLKKFPSYLRENTTRTSPSVPEDVHKNKTINSKSLKSNHQDYNYTGLVKYSSFYSYFKAMGEFKNHLFLKTIIILLGSSLLAMFVPVLQNKWISDWTNQVNHYHFFLLIYLLIGLISALAFGIQHLSWSKKSLAASHVIHDKALEGILRSRLNFFESNSSGRILNRFAKDLEAVEKDLSWSVEDSFMSFLNTLGSLMVMLINLPFIIFITIPLSLIYWKVQKSYRLSMIGAKRLALSLRGHRILSLRETLQGVDVIKVYKAFNFFEIKFIAALKNYQKSFHGVVLINRWFSSRIPLISSLFIFVVCLAVVLMGKYIGLTVGAAGFILIYTFKLGDNLNWNVRAFSEAESHMTSFERLRDYAELDAEMDTEMDTEKEFTSGLLKGNITFKNVFVRYSPDSPDILKGASFQIRAGSKVGVTGRTGTGKSTIFSLLYRFIESHQGEIFIDEKNINSIPLRFLRENIATIPQNPILFTGTVRENLDPFNQYKDDELTTILQRTHVNFLPHGLETLVIDGGKNFSRGQRQLICLSRVLLKKSKIVIVDEASSSVDSKTDELIRDILFQNCPDRTLLIIAHRPESLRGCDSIFHLNEGLISII
jgi:ABC-type multidrug transport system fused ATPase/permease subunit